MNKKSTKVANLFEKDINKLTEHLNIVIEAHNRQLDEIERLKEANKILEENWKHYMMICGKASEFIKEKISSTKGVINDYMYHKEHNQHLIELLNEDIEMYKNELNILQGSEDNENI